jgi:hypothetical protein
MSTARIDPALLTTERPLHDKLSAWILEDAPGVLDITLFVPLDTSSPAERLAVELFAPDRILDIRYRVPVNLAAERRVLSDRFHSLYRSHAVRAALTAPTLAPVPDEQLRHAFSPVAAQGASIFRRLFQPDRFDSHPDDDAPILRDALRSALAREHIVVLKSPEPLFPWAFLHDGDGFDELDHRTLDLGRFWGYRHQIQEEVDGVSRHVRIPAPPAIVATVCGAADPAGEHRGGPLGQLPEGRVTWLPSALALAETLGAFGADCLYFFGHAAHEDPPTPTTSYLEVDGIKLTVERIARAGAPRFSKPLVLAFLNGCGTGPLNTWNRDSLAGFLCFAGNKRVACVTSFAEIPAAFGSALAQRFWADFLAGRTLGESLLAARRALLAEHNNPLGLLYSVLGRVETRLVPPEPSSP